MYFVRREHTFHNCQLCLVLVKAMEMAKAIQVEAQTEMVTEAIRVADPTLVDHSTRRIQMVCQTHNNKMSQTTAMITIVQDRRVNICHRQMIQEYHQQTHTSRPAMEIIDL